MAPHNVEAEESVLGSVLIDPLAIDQATWLKPADFFIVKNGWVWDALLALNARRDPIDFLTICSELEARGQLAEVGGAAYISHLINVVPTAIHAAGYADIVARKSLRRKMLGAASDIAQLAYAEDEDEYEQLDRAEQSLLDIGGGRDEYAVEPLPPLVAQYYDEVKARYERKGDLLGVPTGFTDLDALLGGLQKSDLILAAGRPSSGKTSFLLNIALNAARTFGQRVAMFSLEMSKSQVVERLVAQDSGIDSQRLRTGRLTDNDWGRFIETTGRMTARAQGATDSGPVWVDDTPALSTLQLRSKARRIHSQHGLDLIVVDYLQLMTAPGRHENRTQEVGALSRSLKALARELNVPVLVASQLSRAIEQRSDKRPLLSDLRESGSLEQDSDVVMFIHRDEMYNDDTDKHGTAEIIVAKHRKGPTGVVEMMFRKHLTQFVSTANRDVV
jgi:replicative DNA helicase